MVQGGSFFGKAEILRFSVPGTSSPIVVLHDPFGDNGLRVAELVERYATIQPLPERVRANAIRSMRAELEKPGADPNDVVKWVKRAGKAKRRRDSRAQADAFSQGNPERKTPKDVPTFLKQLADDAQDASGGAMAQHTIKIGHLPAAVSACSIPQKAQDVPDDFCKLADEVLDKAAAAVADITLPPRDGTDEPAKRELAARALHNRREYYVCHGIMYGPMGKLFGHVDQLGHWVVLFNLGNDCTFHAGDGPCGNDVHAAFEFKSDDALVFNGAPGHNAMHGLSRITMGTNPLGTKAWLQKTRTSLQIRQL